MIKKIYTLIPIILLLVFSAIGQEHQNEITISGGTGFSISNKTLKTAVNLGLKEAGLSTRVQNTWMVNGMLELGLAKNISLGLTYTHIQFYWSDAFNDTVQGVPVLAAAKIDVQKRNYGLRGLYHFSPNQENIDIYSGIRMGYTDYIFDVSTDVDITKDIPISDFNFPAGIPSVQILVGIKHYFAPYLGWFGEIALGTAPYFGAVGLTIKMNPENQY